MGRRKLFISSTRSAMKVLKGKNNRKNADGTDVFEDYFTDCESTDEFITPMKTSKGSKVSPSRTEIKRLDRSELTKSPLKSLKRRAEERSLRRNSSAVKSPSKRKSAAMSITSAKKHGKKSKEKMKTPEYLTKDKINRASKIPRVKNKTTPSLDNKKKKHINDDNENIPESSDCDELELSPGKKKKETALRIDSVPLRRSSRQKFPRLATWRNERLKYRVKNDNINFVGIDAGTAEDNGASQQLMRKLQRRKKEKKRK